MAYRPVGSKYPGWGLIAKIDSAEAYAPVRRLRGLLLALGGVALALGLGASNAIARRFARPIRRLAKTSAAVAAGDLCVRSEVTSSDEIGALSTAFNRMTEELARSYATLERRISERTRDLEAVRDLLDAFFRISTSRQDPDNIEKTFDSVLRFCSRLGYDLAMISLVDREAGVIRAARATGSMTGMVEQTVRPLDGDDILAVVVREGRAIVVADSTVDPRCDQAAVALAGIRGQIVVPLVSDEVLGTLQVAVRSSARRRAIRSASAGDLGQPHGASLDRPAAARGDPPAEPDPGTACAGAGPFRGCAPRTDPDLAVGSRLHGRRCRRRRLERAVSGLQPGRRADLGPRADRCPPRSGRVFTRSSCRIG